jgi:hypothetical protein
MWWAPAREAILAAAAAAEDPALELAIDLAFSIGQREADLLSCRSANMPRSRTTRWTPRFGSSWPSPTRPASRCVMGIRLRQAKGKRGSRSRSSARPAGGSRRRPRPRSRPASPPAVRSASGLPWTHPNAEAGQRRFIRRFAELRSAAIATAAATEGQQHELAAELEQLQFRDFRRTAVVFLGELGIADQLIAAITGHSLDETKKILETYMPRTTGMAARAIALSQARSPAAKQEPRQRLSLRISFPALSTAPSSCRREACW